MLFTFFRICIFVVLKLPMIVESDMIRHIVETIYNMEGGVADPGVREGLPQNRDNAAAHVVADVFHLFSLL